LGHLLRWSNLLFMIEYKIYNFKEHDLTLSAIELFSLHKTERTDLSEDIVELFIDWEVNFADKVIAAYENSKLIGFFRYDIGNNPHNIYAAGTWVSQEFRNKGLAFSLWEEMIRINKPERLFLHIESDGGYRLVEKIKNKYNEINYDITVSDKVSYREFFIPRGTYTQAINSK
jgi:hypothetical protein